MFSKTKQYQKSCFRNAMVFILNARVTFPSNFKIAPENALWQRRTCASLHPLAWN